MPRDNRKIKSKKSQVRPRWTKEEVALLRRLYRTHSNAEIAGILGADDAVMLLLRCLKLDHAVWAKARPGITDLKIG